MREWMLQGLRSPCASFPSEGSGCLFIWFCFFFLLSRHAGEGTLEWNTKVREQEPGGVLGIIGWCVGDYWNREVFSFSLCPFIFSPFSSISSVQMLDCFSAKVSSSVDRGIHCHNFILVPDTSHPFCPNMIRMPPRIQNHRTNLHSHNQSQTPTPINAPHPQNCPTTSTPSPPLPTPPTPH